MHVTTESKPKGKVIERKGTTAKAIVIEQYGGPEVLKLKQVEIASPERGQALVRVAIAGVQFC
jgi:D-arabinose 1-dehydrogenase-like Zn-dependent alcohol dehydrogenase